MGQQKGEEASAWAENVLGGLGLGVWVWGFQLGQLKQGWGFGRPDRFRCEWLGSGRAKEVVGDMTWRDVSLQFQRAPLFRFCWSSGVFPLRFPGIGPTLGLSLACGEHWEPLPGGTGLGAAGAGGPLCR